MRKFLDRKGFFGQKDIVTLSCLVVFGLLGFAIILYATTWGPIIFSDSYGYLSVARNISSGKGIGVFSPSGEFNPLTIHPPFYPMLLAFWGLSGLDLVAITRWMHASFFGIFSVLIGWGFYRLTNSRRFALAGSLVILASPQLINLFSLAMTEPTFLLLSMLAALLLLLSVAKDHLGYLIIAALCVGLSVITRYVGAAWIISGFIFISIFWNGSRQRKFQALTGYAIIGVLPTGLWLGWNNFLAGAPAPHAVQSGESLAQRLIEARLAFVNTLWSWLPFSASLPEIHYRLKLLVLAVLAGISIGLVVLLVNRQDRNAATGDWRKWQSHPIVCAASLLWLSWLAYLALIAAGYALSDPTPDLNERTLIMALVIGYGLVLITCATFLQVVSRRSIWQWLPVILAVVLIMDALPHSVNLVNSYHREGAGYLSFRWEHSSTLAAAKGLTPNIPIISNEPSAIAFWLGRPVYQLPKLFDKVNPDPVEARFGDNQEDDIQQIFHDQGAALILFDSLRWQMEPIYFEKTPERLAALTRGLTLFGNYNDGSIYFYPVPAP